MNHGIVYFETWFMGSPICCPHQSLENHLPELGLIHFSALNAPQDSLTHEREPACPVGLALLVCLAARIAGSLSCLLQRVQLLLRRGQAVFQQCYQVLLTG
jgi:hypothetical protein